MDLSKFAKRHFAVGEGAAGAGRTPRRGASCMAKAKQRELMEDGFLVFTPRPSGSRFWAPIAAAIATPASPLLAVYEERRTGGLGVLCRRT
nr:MAG: hypothetical protein TU35_07715 [Thermoproteus sp. AZ2]